MFKTYSPEQKLASVLYLKDTATGIDWYEYRKTLDNNSVKIAVDENCFVRYSFVDPYEIFPVDCSIITLEDLPSEFNENPYGWYYIDGEFKHVTETEYYKNKMEIRELEQLKDEYRELRLQSDLGIITTDKLVRLSELHTILVEKYTK